MNTNPSTPAGDRLDAAGHDILSRISRGQVVRIGVNPKNSGKSFLIILLVVTAALFILANGHRIPIKWPIYASIVTVLLGLREFYFSRISVTIDRYGISEKGSKTGKLTWNEIQKIEMAISTPSAELIGGGDSGMQWINIIGKGESPRVVNIPALIDHANAIAGIVCIQTGIPLTIVNLTRKNAKVTSEKMGEEEKSDGHIEAPQGSSNDEQPKFAKNCARCGRTFALNDIQWKGENGKTICESCRETYIKLQSWRNILVVTLGVALLFLIWGVFGQWFMDPLPNAVTYSLIGRTICVIGLAISTWLFLSKHLRLACGFLFISLMAIFILDGYLARSNSPEILQKAIGAGVGAAIIGFFVASVALVGLEVIRTINAHESSRLDLDE